MYKVKSHDQVISNQTFLVQALIYIDHAFAKKRYGKFIENKYRS